MQNQHSASVREKKILDFWKQNSIFEKSVRARDERRPYVFYDGPPFATGLPHYGHIVASLLKDIVPRYWTMKGSRVERVWGWDCHGLPIENIIEEKLNLKTKKDIERFGIAKFNEMCKSEVLHYAEEWKKIITRFGRWVDMERAYMTMDRSYMESVWWVFSELWKKGLIYEGKKAMHICPRCVTALSNFEVTQGYKDITDIAITVRFRLTNVKDILGLSEPISMLAWTTTPWTLPGNVLLAVGNDIFYAIARVTHSQNTEIVIMAKARVAAYQEKGMDIQIIDIKKGKDLLGLRYEPLFPYFSDNKNSFHVVPADFVSTEEGTGVVHIAPAFGEDDYELGEKEGAGFVQHVNMEGTFTDAVRDFSGKEVKPKHAPAETDKVLTEYLEKNNALFFQEPYAHSYPHCWRCETPLLNYATSSWFVRVTALKDSLVKNNEKITWVPEHMKHGRFGKWLENARDWAISRTRFWGAPLPVWKSEDGETLCISSAAELEKLSGKIVDDLHKHIIDSIEIRKNGKTFKRIPEVLDCWFESGSMPYAQAHYPFENKEKFELGFPAEFIAEGQDQTRGWFYTLHVLASALTGGSAPSIPARETGPAFLHVIANGIVLSQDGKKMSKRLKNYPDPSYMFEQYGADSMRFYLASSPVMHGENLNFMESAVRETYNKVINTIRNVLQFYLLFARQDDHKHTEIVFKPAVILDRWIFSRLCECIEETTNSLNTYHLSLATTHLSSFISDLSVWYVRRSRERCKSQNQAIAAPARATLYTILKNASLLLAPFTPFIAEEIYQALPGKSCESVHLDFWPQSSFFQRDKELESGMALSRRLAEIGHALRAKSGIKVRQPLSALCTSRAISKELQDIICDELNVKRIIIASAAPQGDDWACEQDGREFTALATDISLELKQEGILRDLVRAINSCRKERGLTIKDRVAVVLDMKDKDIIDIISKNKDAIAKATLATDVRLTSVAGGIERVIDGARIVCEFENMTNS